MSDQKNYLDLQSNQTQQPHSSSVAHVDSLTKKITHYVSKKKNPTAVLHQSVKDTAGENDTEPVEGILASVDDNKRLFLKIAGVAGIGMAASALLPKAAEAYVAGSTPTSNVLGVLKNSSNTRIDPATEGTVASIKTQTDKLTFDVSTNLLVTGDMGVQNASNVTINPATEDTLALIKTQTNKLTFDGSNNLLTASSGGASVVGLKDSLENRIDPAQNDSVVLLRRIVKIMESQATVDSANRQKITIDSLGGSTAVTTTIPVSGTVTVNGTVTATVANATIATIAGQNQQMFQDVARNAYANGIRQNLIFS